MVLVGGNQLAAQELAGAPNLKLPVLENGAKATLATALGGYAICGDHGCPNILVRSDLPVLTGISADESLQLGNPGEGNVAERTEWGRCASQW